MRFPTGISTCSEIRSSTPRGHGTKHPGLRPPSSKLELDVQLEGGSDLLRAHNDYAAVAALAGASFENVANMTRPDPCAA